jgi:hypothetical protein
MQDVTGVSGFGKDNDSRMKDTMMLSTLKTLKVPER